MVRLVKGAYWDTEIKRAQVQGLAGFPVFTRKAGTDVCFLACARRLLGMTDRLYPQFATHNAPHGGRRLLHMAGGRTDFEFQRLHGMGEALHAAVHEAHGLRCRIYAPVGAHHDLLAYLVRRLLENGANSSFVNQIVDESVTAEEIARDPIAAVEECGGAVANPAIAAPPDIFLPARRNAKGLGPHRSPHRGRDRDGAPALPYRGLGSRADDREGRRWRRACGGTEIRRSRTRSSVTSLKRRRPTSK